MEEDVRTFGPVQLLSVAFDGWHFRGTILPELERLKEAGIARIIDLLVIRKDASGAVTKVTASDLDWEEATQYGAYIGTLIGLGAGGIEGAQRGAIAGAAELADGHVFKAEDVEAMVGRIPNGSAVGLVLLEHLWMRPLQDALDEANGVELSNNWVGTAELLQIGLGTVLEED